MSEDNPPNVPILGMSKLTDFYGSWISFHDATVESVFIERQGPSVTIVFETCDEAYRDGQLVDSDREARVIIRWDHVQELALEGVDREERNWIDGLTLTPRGECVRSELELMDGLHGVIVARSVEVVSVEPL